jgi:HlyD family secretion protein
MTRRNWILLALAGVLLAGLFAWALRPQPIPVEVAAVVRGTFTQTIEEDGRTRVRERYVVSAPLAGRLARIRLKPGDEVQAGMTVATLWPAAPAMIDARTARELNERVGAARAALAQAQANAARAEAALQQAHIDLERQRKLQGEGFLAPAALDQAQLTVQIQTRALEAARFAVDGARHDLAQAQAALIRARDAAENRRPGAAWDISSPVDGRVLRVLQESETVVGIGAPLLEIADPQDLEVVVDVLSGDGVRIGTGARVVVDAGAGLQLAGRVRRVEPAAFTKVSALGVEEQRVNVIVDLLALPERARVLGDQFRVDARITLLERADALIVPVAALFRDGEQWAVFVADGGVARKRMVRLGGRSPTDAWIEDGVAADERVIVYPSDSVADGRRIAVVRGPA